MSAKVQLKLYDLSKGMAATMSRMLLGTYVEGVWHTGVLVYGVEFFYGGGIQQADPGDVEREYDMHPLKILNLGTTSRTLVEIEAWCKSNRALFHEDRYNLLEWNCNHFSNEICKFLLAKPPGQDGIPTEIVRQHEEIAKTPMGGTIVNLLSSFQKGFQDVAKQQGMKTLWTAGGQAGSSGSGAVTGVTVGSPSPSAIKVSWTANPDPFEAKLRAFYENRSLTETDRKGALRILRDLAGNIVRNPETEKFRTVKAENATISARLLPVKGAEDLLLNMGFTKSPGTVPAYELHKSVNMETITRKYNLLASVVQCLESGTPISEAPDMFPEQSATLRSMGFSDARAVQRALQASGGSVNQAIDLLTSS